MPPPPPPPPARGPVGGPRPQRNSVFRNPKRQPAVFGDWEQAWPKKCPPGAGPFFPPRRKILWPSNKKICLTRQTPPEWSPLCSPIFPNSIGASPEMTKNRWFFFSPIFAPPPAGCGRGAPISGTFPPPPWGPVPLESSPPGSRPWPPRTLKCQTKGGSRRRLFVGVEFPAGDAFGPVVEAEPPPSIPGPGPVVPVFRPAATKTKTTSNSDVKNLVGPPPAPRPGPPQMGKIVRWAGGINFPSSPAGPGPLFGPFPRKTSFLNLCWFAGSGQRSPRGPFLLPRPKRENKFFPAPGLGYKKRPPGEKKNNQTLPPRGG